MKAAAKMVCVRQRLILRVIGGLWQVRGESRGYKGVANDYGEGVETDSEV